MTISNLYTTQISHLDDGYHELMLPLKKLPANFNLTLKETIICSTHRGYIALSGPEVIKFLQGQVTCDVSQVNHNSVVKGAHCSPSGTVIFTFSAHSSLNGDIILEINLSMIEIAIKSLQKYSKFFKLEVQDVSEKFCSFFIAGPKIQTVLHALFDLVPTKKGGRCENNIGWLSCIEKGQYSFTCAQSLNFAVLKSLKDLTFVDKNFADLLTLRTGYSEVTKATTERFIPQMLNLDSQGFISFKKGCYTGQEVIARTHYRGSVKRRIRALRCSLQSLPEPGSKIFSSSKKLLGHVTAAAWVTRKEVEMLAVIPITCEEFNNLQIADDTLIHASEIPIEH
jgi:folate-binding protein YgfZ